MIGEQAPYFTPRTCHPDDVCTLPVAPAIILALFISRKMMAIGMTKLIASATRPTVPALVLPSNGWSTAMPKTGVAELDNIKAQMNHK
jgi:hypothetical protein